MPTKIKKIEIHAFRGITDLDLNINGNNLLIFGENGTGKSSLVDALEFFFTGSVSHLVGVQGISLSRHGPHVDYSAENSRVQLTFDPGETSLLRTFESEPPVPAELGSYFTAARYRKFILRRSQILAFIMSQPADRFREIGNIIGIESLDRTELEIKAVRDDREGKVEDERSKIGSIFSDLSMLLGETVTNLSEVQQSLARKLQTIGFDPLDDLERIDEYDKRVFATFRAASSPLDRSAIVSEINQKLKDCILSERFSNELGIFKQSVFSNLEGNLGPEQANTLDILEKGKQILESSSPSLCPLCEQPIKPDDLLQIVTRRLELVRSLSQEVSKLRISASTLNHNLEASQQKLNSIISIMSTVPELSDQSRDAVSAAHLCGELINKISVLSEKPVKSLDVLDLFIKRINDIVRDAIGKNDKILSLLQVPSEDSRVLGAVRLLEQIKMKYTDLKRMDEILIRDQESFRLAHKVFTIFSEVKKTRIQKIYSAIESDVTRFYGVLHSSEEIGKIELSMAGAKRASAILKMEIFGREGEDPRGLASEGHLDSMGLCIFMAFVKKFNLECPLIVLDDVVSSIDSQHRQNICKLLLEEFKDNQLLVTTHDELWYKQLIQAEIAYGVRNDFQNLRIVGWSRENGPRISEYKTEWLDIQDKIAAGDKPGAGNACRNYLEWILERICRTTLALVPFKGQDPRYEIGDLYPAAKKRLLGLPRDQQASQSLEQKFRTLDMTIMMGNLLSHNNELTNISSIDEVRSFSEAIESLRKAVSCAGCDHFLDYNQGSNEMRCPNSRCTVRTTITTR